MVKRAAATFALCALAAGCGDFESQSIVLDLRVLGATTTPPEIVTDIDPDDPEQVELDDTEVCFLVADPNASRELAWTMTACAPTDEKRCDQPDAPFVDIGNGTIPDPEEAADPVSICDVLPADAQLLAVLEDALRSDQLSGLGGIEVQIELTIRPAGTGIEQAEFAAKSMLYSPRIPEERLANQNPWVEELTVAVGEDAPAPMTLGRCNDVNPLVVGPEETVRIEPIEPEGVREDYLVPTLDGDVRSFTESLRYAWYATHGNWGPETSGGPKDAFGNEPTLWSDWTAPSGRDVELPLDVRMWFVQRDERGGLSWYHGCVRVEP